MGGEKGVGEKKRERKKEGNIVNVIKSCFSLILQLSAHFFILCFLYPYIYINCHYHKFTFPKTTINVNVFIFILFLPSKEDRQTNKEREGKNSL